MSKTGSGFLLVRAGTRRVGLELSRVIEVAQIGPVHPVPSIEPAMRGVMALRDRMLPVLHLGALLEGAPCPPPTTGVVVIVSVDGRRVGLEVDDAEVVIREPALPVPAGATLPWVVGVARHPEGLVPLLDLNAFGSRLMEASA